MSSSPLQTVPTVSVIVPHYNDLDRLDRCLASLVLQTWPAEDMEVVVADNMSPQGEAVVRERIAGRARLVIAQEKGAGPARNAAVAASTGRLLAFIDADCIADPDWLARGLAALDGADLIGGRVDVFVEDLEGRKGGITGAEAFEVVFAFDNRDYVRRKHFAVTANLFCPRSVFDATGPFRNGMSEDIDWCLRARVAGFRIDYADDSRVTHPARPDWPALRKKWLRMNAEQFQLEILSPGGRLRWARRALLLPLSIPAHTPRMLMTPLVPGIGARMAGVATLARVRLWRFNDALLRLAGVRP